MKTPIRTLLICMSLFLTLTFSSCADEETLGDALEDLFNNIDLTGGGPKGPSVPSFPGIPSIIIDSTSTNGSDAITLWMTVSCNENAVLILSEINVEYRNVDSTQTHRRDFLAGPDTLKFEAGLHQAYSIDVEVDSLQASTEYSLCSWAQYILNDLDYSNVTIGCKRVETSK